MEGIYIIPQKEIGANGSRRRRSSIPVLGFGAAARPFGPPSHGRVKDAVLEAIKAGYRHFDTAALYQSEKPLSEAISQALSLRLIASRDDLFITSKLWCTDAYPDRVLPALHKTLQNLQLGYVDLYLIHWHVCLRPEATGNTIKKEDVVPMDYRSVWEAMENCQNLGLAKSIGVSNFPTKKLDLILAHAKIPPAVNQVELNPVWQQKKLRQYCEEKGIHVSAYAPLGGSGATCSWGTNLVMENDVLKQIAVAKGKTVAQVCLRWAYQQGVTAILKSFNKERMKQNLEIFDWELSKDDLEKISRIPQRRGVLGLEYIFDGGVFSSLQQLWDEED